MRRQEFDLQELTDHGRASKAGIILVGSLLVIGGLVALWQREPWLAIVGSLAALVALYWYWERLTSTTVVCDADGFLLTTFSRARGEHERKYKWSDVAEIVFDDSSAEVDLALLRVSIGGKVVLKANSNMVQFDQLKEVFEQMTPHLVMHGQPGYRYVKKPARLP